MEATGGAAGLKVRILARYFLRLKTPEPGSSKSQAQWTKPNIQYAIYTSIDYESHEYDQSALEATRERQQHRRPQQQHRTPPTPPHPCWVPRPTRTARHRALANTPPLEASKVENKNPNPVTHNLFGSAVGILAAPHAIGL